MENGGIILITGKKSSGKSSAALSILLESDLDAISVDEDLVRRVYRFQEADIEQEELVQLGTQIAIWEATIHKKVALLSLVTPSHYARMGIKYFCERNEIDFRLIYLTSQKREALNEASDEHFDPPQDNDGCLLINTDKVNISETAKMIVDYAKQDLAQ